MKYNNKVQLARQKYLKGLPLSDQEQALIEKDLSGSDFLFFTSDNTHFILPDKYTADSTYTLVEKGIAKTLLRKYKSLTKYMGYAAAIFVLAIISTIIYNNSTQPSTLYASTSYGEKKEVTLPDGSVVILNSTSSISYPSNMSGKTREVTLQGEAYFDVAKNPDKTFIVKAEDIEVKVLGTKFNINAYENREYITTTLFEGIVSVGVHAGYTKKLKPGEQAVFKKKADVLEIRQLINSDIQMAWRNNILSFENERFSDILEALSREYNVIFDVDNQQLKQLRITAYFASGESVDSTLVILGRSAGFSYIKQGNKYIIVTPK